MRGNGEKIGFESKLLYKVVIGICYFYSHNYLIPFYESPKRLLKPFKIALKNICLMALVIQLFMEGDV